MTVYSYIIHLVSPFWVEVIVEGTTILSCLNTGGIPAVSYSHGIRSLMGEWLGRIALFKDEIAGQVGEYD
jgi:hypothetical protein